MKKIFFILFILIARATFSQPYTYHLRYDTVKFTTANNSEFVLKSSTRDSTNGILLNIGGGITQFKRIRAISATQFTVGTDTITITGSGGGGGGTYTEGYGIDITSNVVSADTAILGPLWRSQTSIPNLIIQNAGTGQQSWWTSGDTLYQKRRGNTYGFNWTTAADSTLNGTVDSTIWVPKTTTSQITGLKTFTQNITIQKNGGVPFLDINRMGTTIGENLGGIQFKDNSVTKMYSFLANFGDTGYTIRQGNGVSTKSWNIEDKFGHFSLGFATFSRGYAMDVSHASGNYMADSSLIMGFLRYRWINAGSNVVDSFKVDRGANLTTSGFIIAELDSTGTGTAINMVYQGVDKKLYRVAVPSGGSTYTFSNGVFESAGAVKVDTFLVGTRAQTTKRIDSLALLITGGGGVPSVDVQIFTATGANTWTKPAGAKAVFITLVAGGGGGGSGMRGAAGGTRCGGGGAGGGGYASIMLPAAALGATETVTVGAGGAGGAARTSDDQTGANGVAGGVSSFGNYIRAINGTAGTGGSATSGVGGSGGAGWPVVGTSVSGGAGGAANVAGGAGAVGSNSNMGGSGGAAGGGLSVGNTITAGGVGGAVGGAAQSGFVSGVVAGGTAGSSGGGTGGNGGANTANIAVGGGGGGGGGSVITGNAGAGGNSGIYGAGGGGGGASTNGGNSGAGGSGANGIVIIITYF